MIDFLSEKYSGSTGKVANVTSREIDREDADCKTRTGNPWIKNPVL